MQHPSEVAVRLKGHWGTAKLCTSKRRSQFPAFLQSCHSPWQMKTAHIVVGSFQINSWALDPFWPRPQPMSDGSDERFLCWPHSCWSWMRMNSLSLTCKLSQRPNRNYRRKLSRLQDVLSSTSPHLPQQKKGWEGWDMPWLLCSGKHFASPLSFPAHLQPVALVFVLLAQPDEPGS